jgi:hypothetical protein
VQMVVRLEQKLDTMESNVGARLLVLESQVQIIESTQRQLSSSVHGRSNGRNSRNNQRGGYDGGHDGGHDGGYDGGHDGGHDGGRAWLQQDTNQDTQPEEPVQMERTPLQRENPLPPPLSVLRGVQLEDTRGCTEDTVSSIAAKFKQTQAALDGNKYGLVRAA